MHGENQMRMRSLYMYRCNANGYDCNCSMVSIKPSCDTVHVCHTFAVKLLLNGCLMPLSGLDLVPIACD